MQIDPAHLQSLLSAVSLPVPSSLYHHVHYWGGDDESTASKLPLAVPGVATRVSLCKSVGGVLPCSNKAVVPS